MGGYSGGGEGVRFSLPRSLLSCTEDCPPPPSPQAVLIPAHPLPEREIWGGGSQYDPEAGALRLTSTSAEGGGLAAPAHGLSQAQSVSFYLQFLPSRLPTISRWAGDGTATVPTGSPPSSAAALTSCQASEGRNCQAHCMGKALRLYSRKAKLVAMLLCGCCQVHCTVLWQDTARLTACCQAHCMLPGIAASAILQASKMLLLHVARVTACSSCCWRT